MFSRWQRPRRVALSALGVMPFGILLFTASIFLNQTAGIGADVIETITNERPEARVAAFLRA